MGEADILLRTAPPMSVGSDVAARLAAMRANERHDAAAEAPLVRAMIVHLSAGAYRFRESSAYVTLPYRLHLTLARAALASGDLDAMRREIQTCRRLVSDEINLAIDLIPELEQGGWRQEADAMFAENLKTQQDFCRQFPNSAMRHNQLAWLCAECKRQLEEGLDHAKRAVELEPTRTAYIDTLAEVYFQRGEIDAAIEQMKRCIALEPKVSRHRVQLEKFEAAKGK
jgi:tetratricopeptide (TPR) repeat protein